VCQPAVVVVTVELPSVHGRSSRLGLVAALLGTEEAPAGRPRTDAGYERSPPPARPG
jgi:hypothetical protein